MSAPKRFSNKNDSDETRFPRFFQAGFELYKAVLEAAQQNKQYAKSSRHAYSDLMWRISCK
jgi:hypothetical protein